MMRRPEVTDEQLREQLNSECESLRQFRQDKQDAADASDLEAYEDTLIKIADVIEEITYIRNKLFPMMRPTGDCPVCGGVMCYGQSANFCIECGQSTYKGIPLE